MPKTNPYRKLSIDEEICVRLEKKKVDERRRGSLTAYASEILDFYANGFLVTAHGIPHFGPRESKANEKPLRAEYVDFEDKDEKRHKRAS